jgi:hypothetical protein
MMCGTPNVHSLNDKEMHADGLTGARQQQAASAPWPQEGWTHSCQCGTLPQPQQYRMGGDVTVYCLSLSLTSAS